MVQYLGPYDEQNRLRVNVEKDTSSAGGTPPATGTETNVAASTSSVTVLAANASRKGATFFSDSTAVLSLLVGTGTASTTVFTVKLFQNDYYELPEYSTGVYTGIVSGIWTSATGSVRVTEYV
jgi:hypothetical protein